MGGAREPPGRPVRIRTMSLAGAITFDRPTAASLGDRRRVETERRYSESRGTPALSPLPHPTPEREEGARRTHTGERRAEAAEIDWATLVKRCMEGDHQAWAELVAGQQRRVYALCYRFTNSSHDAEDLTQDVFIKVYGNLRAFDAVKGSFPTWITTLTRNLLVDHFRRSRQQRATDSIDAGWDQADEGPKAEPLVDGRTTPYQHAVNAQLEQMVQHALAKVSPELREAVILRDLHDMDYKEIAEVLTIPQGTVKSRISRGRAELARLLERTKGQVM